jgi:hypothetical protein
MFIMKTINYQQVYEEEISDHLKTTLGRPTRFFELSNSDRLLVEELIDVGYQRALTDALDPELLEETASLAGEMGKQLYNFANMVNAFVSSQNLPEDG